MLMKRYVREMMVRNKEGKRMQVVKVDLAKPNKYDYLIFLKK